MRLICSRTKVESFSIPGLTRFLKIRSDLPVVPVGRRPQHEVALAHEANQSAVRRVGKAQACPPSSRTIGDRWLAREARLCPPYALSSPVPMSMMHIGRVRM